MPEHPAWLFDSPLLREALAEVNLPAVPAIVRAACGMSQQDIAAMTGWSQAVLSYYERGVRDGMYDIRTALQFCDAVGMPRTALLPLIFADAGAVPSVDTEAWAGTGPSLREFGLTALSGPRRATSSHIRYWRACTDTLYARTMSVGGTILLPLAVQQWRRVRLAVRDIDGGETGHQSRTAAGEMALCAGWIALDGGQVPLVRALYEEARELAAGSGDALLGAHVLANQSMLYAELARTAPDREPARQALRLAFQAQEEGRYLPIPRLHALIALRHAGAASLLRDRAAFRQAIARARRELERGPENEKPPGWLRFVDRTEVTGVEAHGWLDLGDPGRSARLYKEVLASALGPRDRADYSAGLADALLRQGARQDAITAAMDALLALEDGVASMRCLSRLRLVRQAVAGSRGAEEFCAHFDAIERALPAPCVQFGDDIPGAKADVPALCAVLNADPAADAEAGTTGVLRVADQQLARGLGDLDASRD